MILWNKRYLKKLNGISWFACRVYSGNSRFLSAIRIRRTFIDFYKDQHDHEFVRSSSVIPHNDKSLLFVNAGMNQFKSIFLDSVPAGSRLSGYSKVVNYQKCIRVGGRHNDLKDVGNDIYHHTFFEMLGTWSFGHYFKEDACQMAWKLLTDVFKIPADRLYVTYFNGDDEFDLGADEECKNIWQKIGLPANHIIGCSGENNFWDMGVSGPCGPCTEIHYDHVGGRYAGHLVNSGDPLVTELWNLVFVIFNRVANGKCLKRLSRFHVDGGMGFERLVAVLQGKISSYDTDLFQPIIRKIEKLSDARPYSGKVGADDVNLIDTTYRIISDHLRMFTIAICDGCLPDAVDQGNILRRMIRTAVLASRTRLKMEKCSLSEIVPVVIETLVDAYPDLSSHESKIRTVIDKEEEIFLKQLSVGDKRLEKILKTLTGRIFPGDKAYELYISHGYPLEHLQEMLDKREISINWDEFHRVEQVDKEKQLKSSELDRWTYNSNNDNMLLELLRSNNVVETDGKFVYDYNDSKLTDYGSVDTEVVSIIENGNLVDKVDAGRRCIILLKDTLMYSEAGGQVSDTGFIRNNDFKFEVEHVKSIGNYTLHHGVVINGTISQRSEVAVYIDKHNRIDCMYNHTATHLLNSALRSILGFTNQKSSYVCPDYLRFDYQTDTSLKIEQLKSIETKINNWITDGIDVSKRIVSLNDAMSDKLITVIPGTDYPDPVSLTSVDNISLEPCCGTHVKNTADIGSFKIITNKSVGQTVRSMKAVTGKIAAITTNNDRDIIENLSSLRTMIDRSKHDSNVEHSLAECEKQLKQLRLDTSEKMLSVVNRRFVESNFDDLKKKLRSVYKIHVLPLLLHQVDEEISNYDRSKYYFVHTLTVNGTDQHLPKYALKKLSDRPAMILSRSTDKSLYWCHCAIPKNYADESRNATLWGETVMDEMEGVKKVEINKPNLFICKSNKFTDFEKLENIANEYARKFFT